MFNKIERRPDKMLNATPLIYESWNWKPFSKTENKIKFPISFSIDVDERSLDCTKSITLNCKTNTNIKNKE